MTDTRVTLQAVVAQLSGEAKSAVGKTGERSGSSAFFDALALTRARLDAARAVTAAPAGDADPAAPTGVLGVLVAGGARAEALAEHEHTLVNRLALPDETLAARHVAQQVPQEASSPAASLVTARSTRPAMHPGDEPEQDPQPAMAARPASQSLHEAALADPIAAAPPPVAELRGLLAPLASDAAQRGKAAVARDGVANPASAGQALPNALDAHIVPEPGQLNAALGQGPPPAMLQAIASHPAAGMQLAGEAVVEADAGNPLGAAHGVLARVAEQAPRMHLALEAPLRGAAFAGELSDKLVWLAGRQGQWASLSLNPAHLGALEVRLSLAGGDASAQFFSANPVVREALEAALPKLRELLADAGITLGEAQVRDEAFARREDAAGWSARAAPAAGDAPPPGARAMPAAWSTGGGLGLVDLYV